MTQNNRKTADMGEENITRLLIRFSLPATLAMAVMASYNIVDTYFVGRLGGEAIAALSVSFPVQMLLGALGIGTGVGAGSLISRSLGAKKPEVAAMAAGQVMLLALAFGLGAFLLGRFYLRELLLFFGATPEILPYTMEYMSIIAQGAVMLFMIMMLNHIVRAEGNALLPMWVMISSSLINIALDPIFIFVLGLGIRGAAIATVLAKIIGVAALLWYYISGRSSLDIKLRHLIPNGRIILDIYRVGLPALLMQISANISIILANRILGGFGYIPIAVMGLMVRFQMFAFMPVIGIAQGLLPIIGYNFGAKKYPRIREAMFKGAGAGTLLMTLAGALLFLFPAFFLGFFSTDAELLDMGVYAVRIMVLMYPLLGAQITSVIFFQAIGRGTKSLLLSLLRQFLLYIPFIMLLPRFLGLTGIWIATPLADLLAFAVTTALVAREYSTLGIPFIKIKGAKPSPLEEN